MKAINLTDSKFNKLSVIKQVENRNKQRKWMCLCECGNTCTATTAALRSGKKQSCGCLRKATALNQAMKLKKHGACSNGKVSSEWRSWYAMRCRCTKKYDVAHTSYAANGITVCERWLSSFENFLADMGPKPIDGQRYSIDRIDNTRGYEPSNCRWATYSQQNNNKSSCIQIFALGKLQTVTQWARELGVCFGTVRAACAKYGEEAGIQEIKRRLEGLLGK